MDIQIHQTGEGALAFPISFLINHGVLENLPFSSIIFQLATFDRRSGWEHYCSTFTLHVSLTLLVILSLFNLPKYYVMHIYIHKYTYAHPIFKIDHICFVVLEYFSPILDEQPLRFLLSSPRG